MFGRMLSPLLLSSASELIPLLTPYPIAPPQPSKKELEAAEAQTLSDIKWTAASAVILYLCP
ncbi:hypothetical protein GQ44DRAFT_712996 [Phaeosphaeriaceae sp. PMI808]|nr:hypothetical protein GQ44DRAFT_712996 [Phaeosphaeriaceae sp. PMI808]